MDAQKILKDMLGVKNYKKGLEVDKDNISLESIDIHDDSIIFYFEVGERYWYKNRVYIKKDKDRLSSSCNCFESYKGQLCQHVAGVYINYIDKIFNTTIDDIIKEKTKSIFKQLEVKSNTGYNKKEELKLEVEIDLDGEVNLKIGTTKLYMMKSKIINFLNCYLNKDDTLDFGKNFTYDPKIHYFNEEDERIINFFANIYESYKGGYPSNRDIVSLQDNGLKAFLKLVINKGFTIKHIGYIDTIYENFPLESSITKKGNNYIFNIDNTEDLYPLTRDYEYIVYNHKCYHLKMRDYKLLELINDNHMNSLIFEDKDLDKFSRSILPVVKENIKVDNKVNNIVIVKKPAASLYFDLNRNDIVCNLKLNYNGMIIDYFDQNDSILRDIDFENEVLEDIYKEGFINNNKKLLLEDLDTIGIFLEEGLARLSEKYETFTSQKLKEVSVLKKNKIVSTFSIGKDNIMKFDFELEGITADELDHIFSDLRKKKKYYKLKSGDLINLEENENLKQLEEISTMLDLSNKDITSGTGVIPKYRAIYLDSLKNSNYNIIKTDSLFENFINNFKNYKDAKISFTKEELKVLRDYQKVGVQWLYNIHKCDLGGVLADEMGLGKSLQVLYFIRKLLKEDKTSKFLIVVPTSLVYNWENEIKKFTPEINYQILSGPRDKRRELFSRNTNLYITSYGLLREDFEYYKDINFKVCIIDEAQNIKNTMAGITKKVKEVKAETKFALTGTPLENSVIELWSIFDFIMPGFLSSMMSFQSKYHVKDFDDETNNRLSLLNKQISPFILRRKKVDVLKDLPDKIENNIFIELSDSQKKLYAKEVERVRKEIDRIVMEEGWTKARFLFLQLILRLRQLCIDPSIVYENYKGESTKIEELIKVVKESTGNGHKILMFSSFRTALNIAKKELDKNNISNYVIDGSTPSKKRMELVDSFNNDDTKVFLIMLKAGGTGLNLTSADVVIHLDIWWNPKAEEQATDRAHRIGQKNTVEVIKLIAKGTIEERILELQNKKKILSDKLIEGDNREENVISKLSEEDIKFLLSNEQNNE